MARKKAKKTTVKELFWETTVTEKDLADADTAMAQAWFAWHQSSSVTPEVPPSFRKGFLAGYRYGRNVIESKIAISPFIPRIVKQAMLDVEED